MHYLQCWWLDLVWCMLSMNQSRQCYDCIHLRYCTPANCSTCEKS
jgi:hypothetical protein